MRVRSILLRRYGGYEDRRVEFGPGGPLPDLVELQTGRQQRLQRAVV